MGCVTFQDNFTLTPNILILCSCSYYLSIKVHIIQAHARTFILTTTVYDPDTIRQIGNGRTALDEGSRPNDRP